MGATVVGMARASIDGGKYDPYVDRGVIPRFGRPEELVGALRWLCDDKASGFVTGAVIPVDGGFSAYAGV